MTVDIRNNADAASVVFMGFGVQPFVLKTTKFSVALGCAAPHFTNCVFQRHQPSFQVRSNLNLNIATVSA